MLRRFSPSVYPLVSAPRVREYSDEKGHQLRPVVRYDDSSTITGKYLGHSQLFERERAFVSRLVDATTATQRQNNYCSRLTVVQNTFLDNRKEALAVFDAFKENADRCKNLPPEKLVADTRRVPIVVNCGAPGSGKTTQLGLLIEHFERSTTGKALYITLNGSNTSMLDFDKQFPVQVRLAQRLIHAAVGGELLTTMKSIRKHLGHTFSVDKGCWDECDDDEWEKYLLNPAVLLETLRSVLNMNTSAPLLVLVDELRKLGDAPLGGQCAEAVTGLQFLGRLSQASFISAATNSSLGVTYCAASALAAVDPSKGLTESNRPVFFMPLPPIDLKPWDEWVENQGNRSDREKLVGRTLMWMHQGNARSMDGIMEDLLLEAEWSERFLESQVNRSERLFSSLVEDTIAVCEEKTATAHGFSVQHFLAGAIVRFAQLHGALLKADERRP